MLEVDKALGYFRAKVSTRISTLFCIDGNPGPGCAISKPLQSTASKELQSEKKQEDL